MSKSLNDRMYGGDVPSGVKAKIHARQQSSLNLKFGDVSLMHSNTVHASSKNTSKIFSMALVFKYWDISKDYTLSAKIDQKYRSNDNCAGPDVGVI